ncbi:Cellulose synthase-like protein D4 [Platanthera guangdongensis]|uniref:Cellulose synthase-like protein D4 n=1 Tax=Platanthera guangdongensis TaxID=2320717 RepID=A0ABR2LFV8_9ASPA
MATSAPSSTKKAIRNSGGVGGSGSSNGRKDAAASGQTVKFARRTSSGRYVSLSRDDMDLSGEISGDYMNYTVHIPPTPDNNPVDEPIEAQSVAMKAEEQYVSNSLFTGGFNSVTRAHLMDKMAGAKGSSSCAMPACDGKVMTDEQGKDFHPCDCRFKICLECYVDALKDTGNCPGCKEPYRTSADDNYDDDGPMEFTKGGAPALPAPSKADDRRLSEPSKSLQLHGQAGSDFDHNRWLFETQGTYGYGNAFWPKGGAGGYGDEDEDEEDGMRCADGMPDSTDKPWKPLTRMIPVPAAIIQPYRLLMLVRFVALFFFLGWRIQHPNEDAVWLWGMSVVCEVWFAFSWILDQAPKLHPINRKTDLKVLKEKFETPTPANPTGRSDLPGVDFFVSTADPDKEPPLVTANTILSILAVEYPVEKIACYISDDGGALLTFEAMAEAASFANIWVPFCRKHDIDSRNPDSYFNIKGDPTRNKRRLDFVKDRRDVKRQYDEFKVRINGLPDSIRRRSEAFNAREEIKMMKQKRETGGDLPDPIKVQKATWMADGKHWPGTWAASAPEHSRADHAGILQVMLKPPSSEPLYGLAEERLNFSETDTRLPMLVYVSREKRLGYDHNKKAGAMNALVRASAGMCFMMDRGGEDICYIQFPQRFEGIDPSDRYANHNTVFFHGNMRALDGLQGPVYVGTGCLFRRFALYGFDPPSVTGYSPRAVAAEPDDIEMQQRRLTAADFDDDLDPNLLPKRFGNSAALAESITIAEFQGRPLADHPAVKYGRPPGALVLPRAPLEPAAVAEAVSVISCWYEDKTEWGDRVGWIYGSVTEDVVTGYRMHNRGWHSVYCITERDAFRGSAPINLTDRLHQVLRWATGSVEIFFSRNNALIATRRMKFLQRMAYLNVAIYPFTSVFLVVYCFLPALSLFSGQFIVQTLNVVFLVYLLTISVTLIGLSILEIRWSGVDINEWWRNEQFWLISGTSAHLYAVVQGLLKVMAGIEISFTLTSKSAAEDNEDIYADLYLVKWTSLMIPPITIMMVNLIALIFGCARTIYSDIPQWSKLMGGAFFSFWVLAHLYPFAKGLMGRRAKTPTIVFVWAGLISITISLLWVSISPPTPSGVAAGGGAGGFQFP